jgi:hypothetical protein
MNTPAIKILIYKNDVDEKPIKKIGSITKAHLDGMQDALNQNEDVTEHDERINSWNITTSFECIKYKLNCNQ